LNNIEDSKQICIRLDANYTTTYLIESKLWGVSYADNCHVTPDTHTSRKPFSYNYIKVVVRKLPKIICKKDWTFQAEFN